MNDIHIDPDDLDAASTAVSTALTDLVSAYSTFKNNIGGLGDFLGNDDAGKQLKEEYDPSYADLKTAMDTITTEDLPALRDSLANDARSWRSLDASFNN